MPYVEYRDGLVYGLSAWAPPVYEEPVAGSTIEWRADDHPDVVAFLNPPDPLLPITPRQFWLAAATVGVTEDAVRSAIEQLAEPDRTTGLIEMRHATSFDRGHALVAQIAGAFDLDGDDLDTLWRQAMAL